MMSMLNQAAVEALCSATYLENYLNCMENLPDDLQRVVSQLRELDVVMNDIISDIQIHQDVYVKEGDGNKKQRALVQIQRGLIRSQELGDEKLQLVSHVIEHIDSRARQLEQDLENLDPAAAASLSEDIKPKPTTPASSSTPQNTSSTTSRTAKMVDTSTSALSAVKIEDKPDQNTPLSAKNKRARRQRTQAEIVKEEKKQEEEEQKPPKKKKKRKVKQKAGGGGTCGMEKNNGDKSPINFLDIDPDEPTYCLCEQVSYGEMIGCDNDSCPIEWFHFDCVQLVHKPKGKWYCPKCRGDKPTLKRPDLK